MTAVDPQGEQVAVGGVDLPQSEARLKAPQSRKCRPKALHYQDSGGRVILEPPIGGHSSPLVSYKPDSSSLFKPMSTYTESSRRHALKPIIHSRESSRDSRSSYQSSASAERNLYTSSRSSMGYYSGSQSMVVEEPKERKYRASDAENKYITSTSRGSVEVINQRKRILDPEAPRSSEATSSQYKDTQRHSSTRHSSGSGSHTHSHSHSHRY